MPVIMVTGADDDDAARQTALERGATDFLNKKTLSTELLPRARAHAKYQRITLQLQAQSTLDLLTGLANEHGLLDRLAQDIAYARRHGIELDLMRVEIEDLAAMQQHRGDAVAEQVVLLVANLIRSRIRKEDTAGRIGQGGFAISFPGGHVDGIEHLASWLHDQARALKIDGHAFPVALRAVVVSGGLSVWASARDALDHAQAALERARRQPMAPERAEPKAPKPEPAAPPRAKASAGKAEAAATTARQPAIAPKAPVAEPQRRAPVHEQPKPRRLPQHLPQEADTLQRLRSWLRSLGTNLRAGWNRLFRGRSGK